MVRSLFVKPYSLSSIETPNVIKNSTDVNSGAYWVGRETLSIAFGPAGRPGNVKQTPNEALEIVP